MVQIRRVFLFLWVVWSTVSNMVVAEEHESTKASETGATHYIELHPAFVTNYGGNAGKILYLKADITLRVTADGVNQIEHHMPLIRHELVMLLSGQDSQTVGSAEGKNQIRLAALQAVQQALAAEASGSYIDDLLFTSFIVQR